MSLNIHSDHCISVQVGGMKMKKRVKINSFHSGCVYTHTYYFFFFFFLLFSMAQAVIFKSSCESCCHLQAVGWWWDLFKHSLLESKCKSHLFHTFENHLLCKYATLIHGVSFWIVTESFWNVIYYAYNKWKKCWWQMAQKNRFKAHLSVTLHSQMFACIHFCICYTRIRPAFKMWTKAVNSCNQNVCVGNGTINAALLLW